MNSSAIQDWITIVLVGSAMCAVRMVLGSTYIGKSNIDMLSSNKLFENGLILLRWFIYILICLLSTSALKQYLVKLGVFAS